MGQLLLFLRLRICYLAFSRSLVRKTVNRVNLVFGLLLLLGFWSSTFCEVSHASKHWLRIRVLTLALGSTFVKLCKLRGLSLKVSRRNELLMRILGWHIKNCTWSWWFLRQFWRALRSRTVVQKVWGGLFIWKIIGVRLSIRFIAVLFTKSQFRLAKLIGSTPFILAASQDRLLIRHYFTIYNSCHWWPKISALA